MSFHLWRKCFCSESAGRGSGIKANSCFVPHTRGKNNSYIGGFYSLGIPLFQLSPLLKPTHLPLWSLPFYTSQNSIDDFSLLLHFLLPSGVNLMSCSSVVASKCMESHCGVLPRNQPLLYLFHQKHTLGWGQGPKWSASLRLWQSYSEKYSVTWCDDSSLYFSKNQLGFHFGTWLVQLLWNYFCDIKDFPAYFHKLADLLYFSGLGIQEICWN